MVSRNICPLFNMKNKIGLCLENEFNPGFGNNLPQVVPAAVCESYSFGFHVVYLESSSIETERKLNSMCHRLSGRVVQSQLEVSLSLLALAFSFFRGEGSKSILFGSSHHVLLPPRRVNMIWIGDLCQGASVLALFH